MQVKSLGRCPRAQIIFTASILQGSSQLSNSPGAQIHPFSVHSSATFWLALKQWSNYFFPFIIFIYKKHFCMALLVSCVAFVKLCSSLSDMTAIPPISPFTFSPTRFCFFKFVSLSAIGLVIKIKSVATVSQLFHLTQALFFMFLPIKYYHHGASIGCPFYLFKIFFFVF